MGYFNICDEQGHQLYFEASNFTVRKCQWKSLNNVQQLFFGNQENLYSFVIPLCPENILKLKDMEIWLKMIYVIYAMLCSLMQINACICPVLCHC